MSSCLPACCCQTKTKSVAFHLLSNLFQTCSHNRGYDDAVCITSEFAVAWHGLNTELSCVSLFSHSLCDDIIMIRDDNLAWSRFCIQTVDHQPYTLDPKIPRLPRERNLNKLGALCNLHHPEARTCSKHGQTEVSSQHACAASRPFSHA